MNLKLWLEIVRYHKSVLDIDGVLSMHDTRLAPVVRGFVPVYLN